MIVRKTALEEARRVNELFAICFEMPYTNCPADPEKDDATHWAAFDEDGEMMSTFTVSDFTVQFDGSPCKMGGIGGVATLPQYRRRGGIRRASGKRCRICTVPGMIFPIFTPSPPPTTGNSATKTAFRNTAGRWTCPC